MLSTLKQAKPSGSSDSVTETVRQLSRLKCNNLSLTITEPLFIVPPDLHANATIFGMQPELERLHSKLNSQQYSDRPGAVLLSGLPGAGKTYLARQYVWSHRGSYQDGIFWVDGTSLSSIQNGFDEITEVLRKGYIPPEQVDLTNASTQVVHDYLHIRENWLLVFDGVPTLEGEEDVKAFAQFLPVNINHGSTLYTSVDRTPAKQSQFYEPYLLQVPPLSIEDSCKMLFSRLGIKRPTSPQIQKACMVAQHYYGLPLAIYAVGNYLSSTAKAIERFSINSRPTDNVLAEPFVAILEKLRLHGHYSALNLMDIMCFYDSPVQVNLVLLGTPSLRKHDAMTTTDLDISLKTLSRYGLVETDSDDAALSNGDTAKHGEETPAVVKIHPVIRSVCRDQLRATDLANPGETRYESCLLAAFDVLNTSYHSALASYNSTGDEKLDHKTKEHYQLHVSSLVEHFPRKGRISSEVSQAYGKLIGMSMCIDDEACSCRLEPSSSNSSLDGAGKNYGRDTRSQSILTSPSMLPKLQNGRLPRSENSDSDDDGWKVVDKNKGGDKRAGENVRSNTMNTPFQTTRSHASTSTRSHPSAFMPGELQSPSINRRRTDGSISNTSRGGSSYFDSRRSV